MHAGWACSGSTGMRSVIPMARYFMPKKRGSKLHKLKSGILTWQKTLEVYTHTSGSAQRDAVNMLADQPFPNVPSWMVVGIARRKSLK